MSLCYCFGILLACAYGQYVQNVPGVPIAVCNGTAKYRGPSCVESSTGPDPKMKYSLDLAWCQGMQSVEVVLYKTNFIGMGAAYGHDVEFQAWWSDLVSVPTPGWALQAWWSRCGYVMRPDVPCTKYCRRRLVKGGDSPPEHVWGSWLRHNPVSPGDCFYECMALAMWGRSDKPRSMRRRLACMWRSPTFGSLLRTTAENEGLTKKAYTKAVAGRLWGGQPEARLISCSYPVSITCWSKHGRVLYHENGYCESWSGATPLVEVHVGLDREHYVLLTGPYSSLTKRKGELGTYRAGMPGSPLRLRSRARRAENRAGGARDERPPLERPMRLRPPALRGNTLEREQADPQPVQADLRPPLPGGKSGASHQVIKEEPIDTEDVKQEEVNPIPEQGLGGQEADAAQDSVPEQAVRAARSKRMSKPGSALGLDRRDAEPPARRR